MAQLSSGCRKAMAEAYKVMYAKAMLRLFSGTMPSNPNMPEQGTLLVEVTADSGPVVPGQPGNCLDFDLITDDPTGLKTILAKAAAQVWSGVGLATGAIGWGRLYANDMILGASADALRIDGTAASIGTPDFLVSTAQVKPGVPVTVDVFRLILNGRRR